MWSAWTSIGMWPADWAASTMKGMSCSRAMRPISRMGWTVPVTLLAWVMAIELRVGADGAADVVGIDQAGGGVDGDAGDFAFAAIVAAALSGRRIELWSMWVQIGVAGSSSGVDRGP